MLTDKGFYTAAPDEISSRLIGPAAASPKTVSSASGLAKVRETAMPVSELCQIERTERILKRTQSKSSKTSLSRPSRDQGLTDQPMLRRNQSRIGLARKASQVFRTEDSSQSDESLEVESPKEVSIHAISD